MLTPLFIALWVILTITVVLTVPTLKESHKTHFGIWLIFYITLFIDLLGGWVILAYSLVLAFLIVFYMVNRRRYKNFKQQVVLTGNRSNDIYLLETHYVGWLNTLKGAKYLPKEIGEYVIENDSEISNKLAEYGNDVLPNGATLLLAENKYTSPHLLTLIATQTLFNYDYDVSYNLVRNPATPPKALAIVAQQQLLHPNILLELVRNPHTSEDTLKYIVGNVDEVFNLINETSVYSPVIAEVIEKLRLTNPEMKNVDNRWIIASYSQTF